MKLIIFILSILITGIAQAEALKVCKTYTFESPCVIRNPYGNNDLVASIEFDTDKEAEISINIKGRDGSEDVETVFNGYRKNHDLPILGLYPDYDNIVTLTAKYVDGTQEKSIVHIKTPKIKKIMMYQVLKNEDDKNRYYYATDGVVFDEKGWIRFAFSDDSSIRYNFGDQIVAEDRIKGLKVYSMLGERLKSYAYPLGFTSFTHGLGKKTNGNFLVIGSFRDQYIMIDDKKQPSHREFVIEIDRETGEVVRKIDLAQMLNPHRSTIVPEGHLDYGMNDWCHINGVDYDRYDDSIVISCRHHGMFKVSSEGKLIWLITPKKGLEQSGRKGNGSALWDKVLTAVDLNGKILNEKVQKGESVHRDFKWPTKNHSVTVAGKNIYTLYDNAGNVNDPSIYSTDTSNALVFEVDPQEKTVKEIWRENLSIYSPAGSNVVYLPEKNEVIVFSSSVADKNQEGYISGYVTRYDMKTHKPKFVGFLNKGGNGEIYNVKNFDFYPKK